MSRGIATLSHSTQLLFRRGHTDEVLDVAFNTTATRIATASADKTTKIYDAQTFECLHTLTGHENEISKAISP